MLKVRKILIAPLDWGIGHASRCVPIIDALLSLGQEPLIAAGGAAMKLLSDRFPSLPYIDFPSPPVRYGKGNTVIWPIVKQIPSMLWQIRSDHLQTESFVRKFKIDAVISDNRFGAYSHKVPSVFITHQLHIRMPDGLGGFASLTDALNHRIIRKYNECWVPDFDNPTNLSGQLSRPPLLGFPTLYVGPLSRFDNAQNEEVLNERPDVLVMISGPEPQRSIFEQKVINLFNGRTERVVILRGLPGGVRHPVLSNPNISMLNHAGDQEIASLICKAGKIIARAGYSTIMDLVALQRTALLVPTPGQPEQEYLATLMGARNWFSTVSQDDLNQLTAFPDVTNPFPNSTHPTPDLRQHLEKWLRRW